MAVRFIFILIKINIFILSTCEQYEPICTDISESLVFNEEIVSKLYFEPNDAEESSTESSEKYFNFSQQYSTNFNETMITHPSIIAMIEHIDDIAVILSYATICNYEVVIRSGGHQYSGLSSCNSAHNKCIQIDVSLLNEVTIDNNNNIVSCGPGVTLLKLYTELSANNIFLPAGVAHTVNVGGHVQTNGFGLLTRSIGLLTDFVISFDIIISNGTLINVSKYDKDNDKTQLFHAVLGGNPGNFGVVVRYTFIALKDSDYIDSTAIKVIWNYNNNTYKQLMYAYLDIHENTVYIDNNDVMLLVFMLPPDDFNNTLNKHLLMLFGIWTKNISMNIVNYIVQKVSDQPIIHNIDNDTMSQLLVKNSFPSLHVQYPPMYLRAGYTKTNWKNDPKFIEQYIRDIEYGVEHNLYLQILFQSYGGKNSALLSSDVGSFVHRDIFLSLEMFVFYYDRTEEERDIAYSWVHTAWNEWHELMFQQDKIKLFFGTFNDHNSENTNMAELHEYFYKTNSMYNKLRKIKTKFDPIDLFHYPLGLPLIDEKENLKQD
eukprot:452036_1